MSILFILYFSLGWIVMLCINVWKYTTTITGFWCVWQLFIPYHFKNMCYTFWTSILFNIVVFISSPEFWFFNLVVAEPITLVYPHTLNVCRFFRWGGSLPPENQSKVTVIHIYIKLYIPCIVYHFMLNIIDVPLCVGIEKFCLYTSKSFMKEHPKLYRVGYVVGFPVVAYLPPLLLLIPYNVY